MTVQLCQEILEFRESTTSHDTQTASGTMRFARTCELVAEGRCVNCGYPVCTHHHWGKHAEHQIMPEAS